MREAFSNLLVTIVDFAWGLPLVILLIGGGAYLILLSRFRPLVGFIHAFKLAFGFYHHKDEDKAEGQISHFQALCNALAATIGLGNIAGVAVAITQGGPGAVFWMWMAGLIGMNTKFFECTLSLMYRGHDYRGEVQGGPMYVIANALPGLKPLAYFFAICGLLGTLAMFQVNQISSFTAEQYGWSPWTIGIVSAIMVGYVFKGGLTRLATMTSALVPLMCVLYVVCCAIVLFNQMDKVGAVFVAIFTAAFTGEAAWGGAAGLGVMQILKIGVKRAAFSNEAGIGTAPMAHGNAKTPEPVSEGLVAMLGPFFDTILVCTMTALVILTSVDPSTVQGQSGIILTLKAFENVLGDWGVYALGVSILLFGFSTMLGMANYNQKCWNFLFKGRFGLGENTFIIVFCLALVVGAVSAMDDIINLLDIGYAFMAIPNMIATLILAPRVVKAFNEYKEKFNI